MNDAELRDAARTLDAYNQQLESITRQIRVLQASRDEAVRAERSIEALAAAKPGDEILIPVGASSFVSVKVTEKRSAVVGIGNGVSVEKDFSEAQDFLKKTADEINEGLKKSLAAMKEIQQYTETLAAAVQNEYRKRQQAPRQ